MGNGKNRAMQAKNEKRKKLERQMRKEYFYMQASHHIWAETLPISTEFFFKENLACRTWRQWAEALKKKKVYI